MQMKPETEMIFFDYGGTLDSNGVAWKEHFWPFYVDNGVDVTWDEYVQAFYRSDDSLTLEGKPDLSLTDIVREQVKRVLLHIGCHTTQLAAAISDAFLNSSFDQIGKNLPILKRLREHYRLGIISNNYGNLTSICRETGLAPLMDVMVDSRVVGASKPDAKIFHEALDAAGIDAASAIMVGDSFMRDIRGAISMGMKAVWLRGPEPDPEMIREAEELGVPSISSLTELPALLQPVSEEHQP